jgi:hypothetical protein
MKPERRYELISEFKAAVNEARTAQFEKTGRVSPSAVLVEVKASHPAAWEVVKETFADEAALREVRRAIKKIPHLIDNQDNLFSELLPVSTMWVKDTLCATESLTIAEYRKIAEALDHRHSGIIKRSPVDAEEVARYMDFLKKIERYSRGNDSMTVGDALKIGKSKKRG